jgi:cysteine synthase
MSIVEGYADLVGNTPVMRLRNLFPDPGKAEVFAKMELSNPFSLKDRPGVTLIREAMREGKIKEGVEVVEASSGNTAISLAAAGASMGFPVKIFMHAGCSMERRQILCAFGAKVILTPASELTGGARTRAIEYCENSNGRSFFLNQHSNPHNALAHEETTAPELWKTFGESLHTVIIGMGTCGTLEGISKYLKAKNPAIRVVGFEPDSNAVFSGDKKGSHSIVGIGPGFLTDNYKRCSHLVDEIIRVTDDDALTYTRLIPRKEGVLAGITSGAGVWVAEQLLLRPEYHDPSLKVVLIFCDSGERYLTTPNLFPADNVDATTFLPPTTDSAAPASL